MVRRQQGRQGLPPHWIGHPTPIRARGECNGTPAFLPTVSRATRARFFDLKGSCMTPITEQFLRSVITQNWWPAFEASAGVPPVELFHAVAALDPLDRTALRAARLSGPPTLRGVVWASRI